jgi:hypothetical protein
MHFSNFVENTGIEPPAIQVGNYAEPSLISTCCFKLFWLYNMIKTYLIIILLKNGHFIVENKQT